jgi:hypothetical protein
MLTDRARFCGDHHQEWTILIRLFSHTIFLCDMICSFIHSYIAKYTAMQYVPCDVSTVCFGMAASMGAFLLGAGAPGKRRALPNSRIMIHQPLGGAQGQAADIEIQAKEILFIREVLNTYIADYTGQTKDKVEADCDRDFFMTPEEAVDYGIIDEGTWLLYLFAMRGREFIKSWKGSTSLLFFDRLLSWYPLTTTFMLPYVRSDQNQDEPHYQAPNADIVMCDCTFTIHTNIE